MVAATEKPGRGKIAEVKASLRDTREELTRKVGISGSSPDEELAQEFSRFFDEALAMLWSHAFLKYDDASFNHPTSRYRSTWINAFLQSWEKYRTSKTTIRNSFSGSEDEEYEGMNRDRVNLQTSFMWSHCIQLIETEMLTIKDEPVPEPSPQSPTGAADKVRHAIGNALRSFLGF